MIESHLPFRHLPFRKDESGENMINPPQSAALLSPHWAFVIQLHHEAPISTDRLSGRAEHVTSGQAMQFDSVAQLLRFMQQVLDDLKKH
jgi:hypothetical protein